jgi:hypothetical protein
VECLYVYDSSVDMLVLGTATGAPSTYSPEPQTPLSEHQDKHAFDAGGACVDCSLLLQTGAAILAPE